MNGAQSSPRVHGVCSNDQRALSGVRKACSKEQNIIWSTQRVICDCTMLYETCRLRSTEYRTLAQGTQGVLKTKRAEYPPAHAERIQWSTACPPEYVERANKEHTACSPEYVERTRSNTKCPLECTEPAQRSSKYDPKYARCAQRSTA